MSFSGGGSGGGSVTTSGVQPYEPAKPVLNQILSESGQLYNQGVNASGYVPPSAQTTTGLAQQEVLGTAGYNQLKDTLAGNYTNPYLSPMLQNATSEIANSINSEYSIAGRTPGSAMNQQDIIAGVADYALPLAFNQYNTERQNQLNIAGSVPSLTQTGSQIENIDRQKNLAPFASLQQYAGLVTPIASGFPTQQNQVNTQASPVTTALGGALIGSKFGGMEAAGGALAGLLMGLL